MLDLVPRRALLLPFPRKFGRLVFLPGPGEAVTPGEDIFVSRMVMRHFDAHGHLIEERDTGDGLITTAGVNLLAADWTNANATLKLANYHDSGTGVTAAVIGDTTLQAQAGPTTRATGVQSNPVPGQYRTVGTITYASAFAITEWGIFLQAAQGGTLWDRKVSGAFNVAIGESIQTQYTVTLPAGG